MRATLAVLVVLLSACGKQSGSDNPSSPIEKMGWAQVEKAAKGQPVTLAMWQGDQQINAYMRDYVVPELRKNYGVELRLVGGQGTLSSPP